jgi:hypothetical protein
MCVARPSLSLRLASAVALVFCCALLAAPAAPAAVRDGAASASNAAGKAGSGKSGQRKTARQRATNRRSRQSRRLMRLRRQRGGVGNAVAVRARKARARARRSSAPVDSDLLFNGSRLADFDQVHAAPGAISEVSNPLGGGGSALEFTVDESDVYPVTPTENPRAQALSPSFIDPGEEFWMRTSFLVPTSFPEVDGWLCLSQIYGEPFDGSSPWQIGIGGDNLVWQRNDTYDYDVPFEMPLPKGRWVDVLVHQRFAADGWVEMWIDGQPVTFFASSSHNPNDVAPTQRLAMATVDHSNGGGPNHAKIMQYREAGLFDSATVFFGSLLVGTTRDSVGG